MIYPEYRLGIDGLSGYGQLEGDGCCPKDICEVSIDGLACNFVSLLPNGPLWDRSKQQYISGGGALLNENCTSLVNYAAFTGKQLGWIIHQKLWPAIRESSPETAVTTLDEWLDRLGWVDCYGLCRDPGLTKLSPFEVQGPCGPVYCEIDYPDCTHLAVKSALVRSLSRIRLGLIPNLDAINFVIEPLGAEVIPAEISGDLTPVCERDKICLKLRKTRDQLIVPQLECTKERVYCDAFIDPGCDAPAGLPRFIWPAILAAECILRSILPLHKRCIIEQSCEYPEGQN